MFQILPFPHSCCVFQILCTLSSLWHSRSMTRSQHWHRHSFQFDWRRLPLGRAVIWPVDLRGHVSVRLDQTYSISPFSIKWVLRQPCGGPIDLVLVWGGLHAQTYWLHQYLSALLINISAGAWHLALFMPAIYLSLYLTCVTIETQKVKTLNFSALHIDSRKVLTSNVDEAPYLAMHSFKRFLQQFCSHGGYLSSPTRDQSSV